MIEIFLSNSVDLKRTRIGSGSFSVVNKLTFVSSNEDVTCAEKDYIHNRNKLAQREYNCGKYIGCEKNVCGLVQFYGVVENKLRMKYYSYTLQSFKQTLLFKDKLQLFYPLMRQLLQGLNTIYAKKCVHCDITPGNILINPFNNEIEAVISDYGSMKNIYSNITITQSTFRYASPETRRRETNLVNSDIYSLGLSLVDFLLNINFDQLEAIRRKPIRIREHIFDLNLDLNFDQTQQLDVMIDLLIKMLETHNHNRITPPDAVRFLQLKI